MRILMFLIGAGLAFLNVPVQAVAFVTIAPSDTGRASALYNAQRLLGNALGVAVVSTVISLAGPTLLSESGAAQPNLTAYHLAFLAAAVLVLVAVCAALTISDRDAAITMRRKSSSEPELERNSGPLHYSEGKRYKPSEKV